jgi:hypothetical protein
MKQNLKEAYATYINTAGVEVYITGVLVGDLFYFNRDKYIDFGWVLEKDRVQHDEARAAGYTHGWYLVPNTGTFFFQSQLDNGDWVDIKGKAQLTSTTKQETTMLEEGTGRYYKVMLGDERSCFKCIYTNNPNQYQEVLAKANAIIEEGLPDVTSNMLWSLQPDLSTYRVEIDIKATHSQEAIDIAEEMLDGMRDKHRNASSAYYPTEFNGQLIKVDLRDANE